MIINHNIPAMNTHRMQGIVNRQLAKNLEKLSSGMRINRAADDAAGLAISEKMRAQIRGFSMAERNVQDGISMIQTAEGGCNEIHGILQRMRELSVQSANDTNTDQDRKHLDNEFRALKSEITQIAESNNFNGIRLLVDDTSTSGISKNEIITDTEQVWKLLGWPDIDNLYVYGELGFQLSEHFLTPTTAKVILDRNQAGDWSASLYFNSSHIGTVSLTGDGTYNFFDYGNGDLSNIVVAGNFLENTKPLANPNVVSAQIIHEFEFNDGRSFSLGTTLTIDVFAKSAYAVFRDDEPGKPLDDVILHTGANADQNLGVSRFNLRSNNLGNEGAKLDAENIAAQDNANNAIAVVDSAINQVSAVRVYFGTQQNRLEHTLNKLGISKENLQSAESIIRDVNMAKEMMGFMKNNILLQSSQAMLAQANQLPQNVLTLLR